MRAEVTATWWAPWEVRVTSGVLEGRSRVGASLQQRISSLHRNKITPQSFRCREEGGAGSDQHLRPWESISETFFMNSQAGLSPHTGQWEPGGRQASGGGCRLPPEAPAKSFLVGLPAESSWKH